MDFVSIRNSPAFRLMRPTRCRGFGPGREFERIPRVVGYLSRRRCSQAPPPPLLRPEPEGWRFLGLDVLGKSILILFAGMDFLWRGGLFEVETQLSIIKDAIRPVQTNNISAA